MGLGAKNFLGIDFYRSGAYGTFKPEPDAVTPSDWHRTMVIIGTSENGNSCLDTTLDDEDRVIQGSYKQVSEIMKKGELMDAAYLASQPGSDGTNVLPGPSKFILLNILPNVKATLSLPSTNALASHTLDSTIAGPNGNKTRIKKTLATKKIEVGDSTGVTTSPVLSKACFDIAYTGDATTAVLTIDATGLTVTLAGDQTDGSLSLTCPFTQFETVGEILDYINSIQGYVATLLDNPDFETANLDHIEATDAIDVKTIQKVYADLWMEEKFLQATGLIDVTVNALRKPIGDMVGFAFLSGGATGVAPVNGIKDAIDFSTRFPAITRNILSSTLSDATYLKQVCYDMLSPQGGNETFGGAGSGLTDIFADRLSNSNSLGSYWINYGISNFIAMGADGTQKTFPGYMLSVIDNAITASGSPRTSPTYKNLNIIKATEIFSAEDQDEALKNGCIFLFPKPNNGPWSIQRSITTEKRDNIILNNKSSVVSAMWMTKRLRDGFNERFIGKSPVDASARVEGFTDNDIKEYIKAQLQQFTYEGLLVGSSLLNVAAYSDTIKIGIDQNSFYIEVEGSVTMTIDFIFYLMNLKTIKGTV